MSIEAQKQIRENTMVLSTFYLLPFVLLFLQCLSYDDVAECFYALVLLNAESQCQFSAETSNIVHAFARKQCVENTSAVFSRRFSFFLFLSRSSVRIQTRRPVCTTSVHSYGVGCNTGLQCR
jgi:hypothetical protein